MKIPLCSIEVNEFEQSGNLHFTHLRKIDLNLLKIDLNTLVYRIEDQTNF